MVLSGSTALVLMLLTISMTIGLVSAEYPGPDEDYEADWGFGMGA